MTIDSINFDAHHTKLRSWVMSLYELQTDIKAERIQIERDVDGLEVDGDGMLS